PGGPRRVVPRPAGRRPQRRPRRVPRQRAEGLHRVPGRLRTECQVARRYGGSHMSVTWRGVFPAVCTQFHADQSLDVAGTLAHVDAMLAAGCHGLVMLGTVGENCSLEPAEKRELLRAAIQHVGKRVPVLTGVAEYTTAGA